MIPLSYFLIAWLVLIGLQLIMSLVSMMQMMRFGIAGPGTYAVTGFYSMVLAIVILSACLFFITVDWTQTADIFQSLSGSPFLNP